MLAHATPFNTSYKLTIVITHMMTSAGLEFELRISKGTILSFLVLKRLFTTPNGTFVADYAFLHLNHKSTVAWAKVLSEDA
jgi:hypothetical protein